MLHHPSHDKLTWRKLLGMTRAFAEQPMLNLAHLGFEERLGLTVDHKATEYGGKTPVLRLQHAKLKPNMSAEDTDYRHARRLDRVLFQRLLTSQMLSDEQNVLLTSPTGVWQDVAGACTGKSRLPAVLQRLPCPLNVSV